MAEKFKGKPGDLISRDVPYQDYIGGQELAHLVTDSGPSSGSSELLSNDGKVKRKKLTKVVAKDRYQLNNLLDDRRTAREANVIVKEAYEMVGRKSQYNLVNKNSEHFATEMRYGKAESFQFKGKPGDLIEISRGPYQHWAVYIGGNEVVHFTTDGGGSSGSFEHPSFRGKVKREKFTDVVGNDRYQVNNLLDDMYDARDPSIIVKEACKMVGRELQYNLVSYNCEHFATEMRYGVAVSRQFNVKPGDLIEISRGPYQHWAVYIGGDEVVHFTSDGVGQSSGSFELLSSRGEVKREEFTDVVKGHSYQVNNLLDDLHDARDPSIIVKEACEMVGRELQYNLVSYNCEHFATEMRYGKAESWQFKGKPGDLIEIFRGHYQHWAVYIGGDEVVHFGPYGCLLSGLLEILSSRVGVKRKKLSDVVGHHRFKVNNLLDEEYKARNPSIIVKEACAMVGRKLPYNLVSYNCEHFATEMRYGKPESWQFNGKPGDLIEIFRGSYKQWAVYIGGDEVVHFTTDGGGFSGWFKSLSSSTGTVKREKLSDVVGHHRFKVNNLQDEVYKACDPSIIVREARAMVGLKLPYNVVTNNSEHFATNLRYGKAVSRQFNGKPGDLIEISRRSYKQWAVYIGGYEVVHFTTEGVQSSGSSESLSISRGEVKREKLTNVIGNDRYQVNNLLDDSLKAHDPSIIVKEACEMVDHVLQYNIDTYNCEHFATDLRYGKAASRQFIGKPGDLIEISRGPYQHWAVYIGKNEVVHFTTDFGGSSGPSKLLSCSKGYVKLEKFTDVVKGHPYQVNNLLDEEYKPRDPSIIVKEACAMVGRELQYTLLTSNCEHFATDLRYGVAKSRQVKIGVSSFGASAVGVSAIAATSFVVFK